MTPVIEEVKPRIRQPVIAPMIREALKKCDGLGEDIKVILSSGTSRTTLARVLHVSRVSVWRWQRGLRDPALIFAFILEAWAAKIRKEKEEVKNHGSFE